MDNIEDIYYNKYLKYKYKYLELKGKGFFFKSQEEKNEENLYGPELLEEIKSFIQTNNISKIDYKRIFDINILNNFESSLIEILKKILEKILEKEELTKDIQQIIKKIENNNLEEKDRIKNYYFFNNDLFFQNFLIKNKSLSTIPILNKLFKLYFKIIKKEIEKKIFKKI
jgi:hypothetical protein